MWGGWLRRRVDASKRTGHFAAKKLVGKLNAKWNSSVNYSVNSIDWASFFAQWHTFRSRLLNNY